MAIVSDGIWGKKGNLLYSSYILYFLYFCRDSYTPALLITEDLQVMHENMVLYDGYDSTF